MVRIIKLLFLYLAYQFAFYAISTGVYMIVENGSIQMSAFDESSVSIPVIIASQFLSTLALGIHLIVGKYVKSDELRFISEKKFNILMASVVFVVGMGMWTNYFSEMAELPDNMKEVFAMMMSNPFGVVSIVVLAPIVEELLFRGAIQGYLMRKYGNPYWCIVLSSLIFSIVHANPAQIPFAFVLGMALGWMYYLTGSLVPSVLMHFVNNGSAVLLAYIYDDPDATMISCFGDDGAMLVALSGILITAVSIWFIRKKIIVTPICWKEESKV